MDEIESFKRLQKYYVNTGQNTKSGTLPEPLSKGLLYYTDYPAYLEYLKELEGKEPINYDEIVDPNIFSKIK